MGPILCAVNTLCCVVYSLIQKSWNAVLCLEMVGENWVWSRQTALDILIIFEIATSTN